MTDFTSLLIADRGQKARAIHLVDKDSFPDWVKGRGSADRALLAAQRFDGTTGFSSVLLLAADGEFEVVSAVANARNLSPWCLAKLAESLPEGHYKLAQGEPGPATFGWLVAQHKFDRYKTTLKSERGPRILLTGEPSQVDHMVHLAEATALVRDLVDTPAADMGPAELEDAVRVLAGGSGAKIEVRAGDALIQGYPMIAGVGGGASKERAPRLIELQWGNPKHPPIAIVGKGVSFDTGGLDLKPASGMRLMKKDMGGAAHALALGRMVMAAGLPVALSVLVPVVENAIAGDAMRPGDVLATRAGLTVEVGNTDAEGRLILADALTRAAELEPALTIDLATLTGAARVALGPQVIPFYTPDDDLALEIEEGAREASDPVWRMPLWEGYREAVESDIADLKNDPDAWAQAGSMTAALFLQRFAPTTGSWVHFDIFAWNPKGRPGFASGGEAQVIRGLYGMLKSRFPKAQA